MADMAASVLARLKIKPLQAEEVTNCACSFFARKNSCAVWKSPDMLRISS